MLVKRHSAGSESKTKPWFKRIRTDLGSLASDPPPTPPLKDDWTDQEEYKNCVTQGQHTHHILRKDSGHGEHKQATSAKSKFFKIFNRREIKRLHGTSELALTGKLKYYRSIPTFKTLILHTFLRSGSGRPREHRPLRLDK